VIPVLELARSLARGQEGQAMTEYVLILTFVSIVSALVLTQLGTDVLGLLQQAVNAFP
jgi:Flp pilus assembly pilin Flp